jgi:hypothetical protein
MTTNDPTDLPLAATRPLRTDELRALVLYSGVTLAAMGLLLVPPFAATRPGPLMVRSVGLVQSLGCVTHREV